MAYKITRNIILYRKKTEQIIQFIVYINNR